MNIKQLVILTASSGPMVDRLCMATSKIFVRKRITFKREDSENKVLGDLAIKRSESKSHDTELSIRLSLKDNYLKQANDHSW